MENDSGKRQKWRGMFFVSVLFIGVFVFGFGVGKQQQTAFSASMGIINATEGMPENVDFASFWKVWQVLENKYVATATTTTQDKVWGAIGGLVSSLGDPYTVFLPPEEKEMFESDISGQFEGVGMEIGIKDAILTVVAPLKGTPAYKAGIKSGDKILKIDDKVTTNMTVEQAVKLIRGPRDTKVTLTILREIGGEPKEISITRAVIDIPTIDTEIKEVDGTAVEDKSGSSLGLQDSGVFVIRLYNFSAPSAYLFQQALRQFVLSGSDKLILDLRNNPGGYLDSSVEMASWFIPQGKVVVQEDFGSGKNPNYYRSRGYNLFGNRPLKMVILINGGSASASEILAGALKEHGVATLVGTPTFGKGSVQELIPITDDTALKVTIARWLTPNGVSISEEGLTPDEVVEITNEDAEKGLDPQFDRAVEILTNTKM
ncbi:MAG: S41 family peptidase [bacterium]|nr:S41 family peptidase [bacterium]